MRLKSELQFGPNPVNRRDFMKWTGSAAILLANPFFSQKITATPKLDKPKNFLIILTDQQHIDTLSADGCPYVHTPAMDRLKEQGVFFKQSYSTNPVCSPARSSILTGRMPSETGVYANGLPIRSPIPNIGQWFTQNSDTETVYAGKWHLPGSSQRTIEGFTVLPAFVGGQGNIGDTAVSRIVEGFLWNRTIEKPFLLVASFLQPHDICEWLRINSTVPSELRYPSLLPELPPLPENFGFDENEPESVISKRNSREGKEGNWTEEHWRYYLWSYYRHIEMVDAEIGRVLTALDDTGYAGDTMIVFTSDHGEGLSRHQMTRKSILYDEAARVPLIVSWPGKITTRKDETHLVSGLDILPTICDFAGISSPDGIQGQSLRTLLEEKPESWNRPFIVSEVSNNSGRMVRSDRYKYITYTEDPIEQLFDMQADPGELKNLALSTEYASILKTHRAMLIEWESRLDVAPDVPRTDAWWYKGSVNVDFRNQFLPDQIRLHQAYPNPFNPSTKISFETQRAVRISLTVFNIHGQKIETLLDKQVFAGNHEVEWHPQQAAAGLYWIRLKSDGFTQSIKVTYIR